MFNHDGDAHLALRYSAEGMSYGFSTPNRAWSKGEEVPPLPPTPAPPLPSAPSAPSSQRSPRPAHS